MERLPDEAWVVRGGRNQPEDIERAMGTHPCGVAGISVQCAAESSIEQLAEYVPHSRIGVTTVAAVRAQGGDVIATSGRSPCHATLTHLDPAVASQLLTPTIRNPMQPRKG